MRSRLHPLASDPSVGLAPGKRPFSQAWRHAVLPRLVRAGRRPITNRATLLGPSGSHLTSSWVVSWAYCSGIIVMSAP